ncbi:MAG: hypothetical protein WAZ64_01575, partial [Candidatus Moraniibacteriota bacterium]
MSKFETMSSDDGENKSSVKKPFTKNGVGEKQGELVLGQQLETTESSENQLLEAGLPGQSIKEKDSNQESAVDKDKALEIVLDKIEKNQNLLRSIESGEVDKLAIEDIEDLLKSKLIQEIPAIEKSQLEIERLQLVEKIEKLQEDKNKKGTYLENYKRYNEIQAELQTLNWLNIIKKNKLHKEQSSLESQGIAITDGKQIALEDELKLAVKQLEESVTRKKEVDEILNSSRSIGGRWVQLSENGKEAIPENKMLQHYLQARTKLSEVKGYEYSRDADFNDVAFRLAQTTVDKPEKLDEILQHYLQARTKLSEVKG